MSADPTVIPIVNRWEPKKVTAKSTTPSRPEPLRTLLASARRMTSADSDSRGQSRVGQTADWQNDAWDLFDLVGEQRFLATTLAGRLSQAGFYVGTMGEATTDAPEPSDNAAANDLLTNIGGGPAGLAQVIHRLALNLWVAGDGWLVGIPPEVLDGSTRDGAGLAPSRPSPPSLDWRTLSVSEVSQGRDGEVTLNLDHDSQVTAHVDDLWLVRVWRPHPRRSWEADSPTRASLPVLRELVGLTMHISAQVDSRLAGAGLLLVPQSAQQALRAAAGVDEDAGDQFTEALMEAMMTPIQDRDSASAVVPLVVTVPDEAADKFEHISFSSPLDGEARELRDEAIRRLALGQDAPPELLLGTGGMNHWGAWLVREDVVTTHLEPPLALISDALTTQYLWPALIEQGMKPEEAEQYVIWYDVSDLVARPNRSDDAKALHASGVLSDEALRRETGFDENDAPPPVDESASNHPEVDMALDLARANPALFSAPGLPSVVAQIRKVLDGEVADTDMTPLRVGRSTGTASPSSEPPPSSTAGTDTSTEETPGGPSATAPSAVTSDAPAGA